MPTWVDGVTPVDAANLNAMEDEIEEVRGGVDELSDQVGELNSSVTNLLSVGTSIAEGTDLNTLTTPGKYFASSGNITVTLTNCPISANYAFSMWVFRLNNSRIGQIIIRNLDARLYIRSDVSYDWYEFTGSIVS